MSGYTANRLPSHAGRSGWDALLGERKPNPRLEAAITADVAVIGAGFAGLSAARRLGQLDPGAKIVLIEAGRIAEGAAGRNSGFMIDLPHDLASADYAGAGDDRAQIARNRHAIAFAADAVADYGISPEFFDRAGKVNGAAGAAALAHNASYARHLTALGEAHEMLDATGMRALTGSAHYAGGLYTPGTVLIQPAGYVRGFADGLIRDGVQVHEDTPALNFTRAGHLWRVRTPKGSVTAPRLILAVNGHLESFGILRGRLMQLFLFAVMTPALPREALARIGGADRWGLTPADPMGTSLRRFTDPSGSPRILTRTAATLRPGMTASAADLARAHRLMQAKFDARFPALSGMAMEHAWAGHLCLSKNGVAVMREIEDGVFSACVQNGLGTTRGTLTGIGAAELACRHTSPITDHFTAEPAPSRLPPRPFRDIGANAFLRWREWRARAE